MWNVEVMHGSFYPEDEAGALGLLFGVDSDDEERVTLVVDPEWLRMTISFSFLATQASLSELM